MSSVVVLTPNGRRQIVKCTLNTTILEILELTCQKHDFQVEKHELKHHNKTLDVSIQFRFSGLPNNAQLEMVESKSIRQETEVFIGLQLESGERVTGTFAPHQTLLEIIEVLVKETLLNPVIIYMRKEVYGDELNTTSLKMLGVTGGRVMLRLINKKPEELKQQANVSTTILSKPREEEVERPKQKTAVTEKKDLIQLTKDELVAAPSSSGSVEKMEVEEPAPGPTKDLSPFHPSTSKKSKLVLEEAAASPKVEPVEHQIITLGERNAVLFSLETVQQTNFDDIPDSFFELTVTDVKKLYYEMKRDVESMNNKPLLTNELREADEQQQRRTLLTQYKQVILRIQFPERYVLQGTFLPEETIEDVRKFIRGHLKDAELDFHLFSTPPKHVLEDKIDLIEAKCVPQAIVHFGTGSDDTKTRHLKDELYEKVSTAAAAASSVTKLRGNADEKMFTDESTADGKNDASSFSAGATSQQPKIPNNFMKSKTTSNEAGASMKLPKWFKPSK